MLLLAGALGGLAGCAAYTPLDLPGRPALAPSLAHLRHPAPGRALTPDDLALLAAENSPDLAAVRTQHATAAAAVLQASILPNPNIVGAILPLAAGLGDTTAWNAAISEDIVPLITLHQRKRGARAAAAQVDAQILWQAWQTMYQQQQIAFAGLARVFLAALVAEFILLLLLYERFWLPVIIIGCSLLSTTAVFTGLWVTGVQLNITALMGMTMIIGIGTEMAIFLVSEYTELANGMPPRQALREASRNRLRPITMTTLAAILTLLPLALAIGQGSAIQQPLAIAIISGLLLQFPLVLVAMPVLIGMTAHDRK